MSDVPQSPTDPVLDTKQNKVGTTLISSYDYAVDAKGQRTAVATSDRSYQYDTIGNRQKTADSFILPTANNYTANSLNQYPSFPSFTSVPSHDLDGNMTRTPLPTAPATNSNLTCYPYDTSNCIAEYEGGTGVSPILTLKKNCLWSTGLSSTVQAAGGVASLPLITDHSTLITLKRKMAAINRHL